MSYYNLISTKNLEIHKRISFINDKQPDTSPLDTSPLDTSPLKSSCYISYSLYDYLSKFKKQIEVSLEAWDNIKKYTNPYEFIHTLIPGNKISVSKLKPLSRSFYKMIEIWKIFKLGEVKNCSYSPTQIRPILPITTFHLAEGPGGFIEATSHIRKNTQDSYYGMTLLNDDPGCPGWKKSNTFLENNSFSNFTSRGAEIEVSIRIGIGVQQLCFSNPHNLSKPAHPKLRVLENDHTTKLKTQF
jgi:hypothetical protein